MNPSRTPNRNIQTCAPACDLLEHSNQLIVFARVPKLGQNKTRLIPALGAEKATQVYQYLAKQTLAAVRQLASQGKCRVTVQFTGGTLGEIQAEFGDDLEYCEQQGAALGERLKHATSVAFKGGAQRVVVIGTDCPSLTSGDLERAFDELERHDVVLGPALDGGYYLIGLTRDQPLLFEKVDWSTALVFEQTVQRARSLSLRLRSLSDLPDVDYPEDLLPLRKLAEVDRLPLKQIAKRLTVVIPALDEAETLPATLHAIGCPHEGLEIIVVDAGSNDETRFIAEKHGCRVFIGNRGRARQMNAGAAVATGEFLLFLHADTLLPKDYRHEIDRILSGSFAGGAFPLRIDARGIGLRMVEAGTAFRTRLWQLPYGDQAIFFRATDFFALKGFKNMAIMEDYEMMIRIRQQGRIGIASYPVYTSGRRWQKKGILKTTWINQLCVIAYRLGFSDASIVKLYHGATRKNRD